MGDGIEVVLEYGALRRHIIIRIFVISLLAWPLLFHLINIGLFLSDPGSERRQEANCSYVIALFCRLLQGRLANFYFFTSKNILLKKRWIERLQREELQPLRLSINRSLLCNSIATFRPVNRINKGTRPSTKLVRLQARRLEDTSTIELDEIYIYQPSSHQWLRGAQKLPRWIDESPQPPTIKPSQHPLRNQEDDLPPLPRVHLGI
jgi:hypothetical protein